MAHGGEGASRDDTAQRRRYAHAPITIRSGHAGAALEEYHPTGHHQFDVKLSSRECVI